MSQARRLKLQEELERLLNTKRVYFQPPESVKIGYPSIVYDLSRIQSTYAENRIYKLAQSYKLTYISEDPDDDMVEKILNAFHYCEFDRVYKSDNLYHYVFNLYY